jgi:hypothetical protein
MKEVHVGWMVLWAALCLSAGTGVLNSQTVKRDPATVVEMTWSSLPDAPMVQAAVGTQPDQSVSAPAGVSVPTSSVAQQTPAAGGSSSDAPALTEDAKQKQHDEAERELKVQEKQRLLGVMPQFQVVMGGTAVPLTPGEKMRLALHSAIDPFYIAYAFVVGGGYGELVDSHPGFGWGPPGYFKRVGASYADNVNGAIIGNAVLPILLHQDPRYFRKGTGPVFKRFLYAAAATVVCRGDNGKNQANVSNVLGNFISGAISNAYYPANERGVSLTLVNGIEVTAFGAVGGQVLEFGPDLARLVHHKRKLPAGNTAPTGVAPSAAAGATGSRVQPN